LEHCQKIWGKIIERLGKLIKFKAQHPLQGQNMIKFKHNRSQISCRKHVEKRYDGANAPIWNYKIKPFVA
jgi:hypothetical protein